MADDNKPTKAELLNAFCQMFRAITRPAVTVIFAAVIAQAVLERIAVPQWFLALASGCILWWFGDRTVQHIKEKGGTNAKT
jgi:hypothetical protein